MGAEGFGTAERLLQKVVEGVGAALPRDQVELGRALRRRAQRRERRVARLEQEEVRASLSSMTLKCAGTLASNGKSLSNRSAKACSVWILRPPGVSIVRANNCRAKARSGGPGAGAPLSTIASARASSRKARPVGELSEDALGHVGRRRLGVGEAQDLRRRRSGEQQPHHALGQDMGLAAAGVGRHPGRGLRV